MNTNSIDRPLATLWGCALVFPAAYFISSACLYYIWNVEKPWALIVPIFEQPQNRQLGLNINLVILLGPLLAIAVNLKQVLRLRFVRQGKSVDLYLSLKRFSIHWIIVAVTALCLTLLAFYLLAEK